MRIRITGIVCIELECSRLGIFIVLNFVDVH